MNRLHSRRCLEHFGGQMRDAADAGRGVIHLLRQGARIRDQLRDRVGFHIVGDRQNQRRGRDRCDRVVLLDRIEGGLFVEGLADSERVLRHQERIAVRIGRRHVVPSDVAAGARLVLDQHGLAQRLAQLLRDLASKGVRCPARGKRHHQPDRPIRIGGRALRLRQRRGAEHGA